jgi:hypothetical protein
MIAKIMFVIACCWMIFATGVVVYGLEWRELAIGVCKTQVLR